MLTEYQSYRSMSWTTDADECENDCGVAMSEERYVPGRFGHYCSRKCRSECERGGLVDEDAAERRQVSCDR